MARGAYVFRRPDELVRERRQACDDLRMRMEQLVQAQAGAGRVKLDKTVRALALLSPRNQFRRTRERLAEQRRRLRAGGAAALERFRARLAPARARLDMLSPVAILSRGYALAFRQETGELVRDAAQLTEGDALELRFGRGGADASVTRIKDENHGST